MNLTDFYKNDSDVLDNVLEEITEERNEEKMQEYLDEHGRGDGGMGMFLMIWLFLIFALLAECAV